MNQQRPFELKYQLNIGFINLIDLMVDPESRGRLPCRPAASSFQGLFMLSWLRLRLRLGAQDFQRDRRGAVALIFAIMLLPLCLCIGAAVDYARILRWKGSFDNSADAAALAAASQGASIVTNPPSAAFVQNYFSAELGAMNDGVTVSSNVTMSQSVTSYFVNVSYTATIPTTLMRIIGVNNVTLSGNATAAVDLPKYADFYLLLDNSPSMGLAATTADINKMQSVAGGCAFACHLHSFDSSGRITGDNTSDNYHVAKNNNITTRIDVLRTATQQLTTTAQNAETVANQYRMAVYTFSDIVTQIASLTSNLASVSTAAGSIDLAYAYYDQRDTQTDFGTALSYISSIIPAAGDGTTQSNTQKWLFIVTDGVEDKPVKSASGSGDKDDKWKTGGSGWPANSQPNLANTINGNVSGTRLIQTLTPSLCSSLKTSGVKIAVLYTTYLPVTTNGFYNQWVAPIASTIPTNLGSCATPGFYFEVSPSGGIDTAMQQMFMAALSSARLTK